MVKAALVAGMYPNLVNVNQETSLLSSNREKKVHFHPTSVLSQSKFMEVGKKITWFICNSVFACRISCKIIIFVEYNDINMSNSTHLFLKFCFLIVYSMVVHVLHGEIHK